VAVDDSDPLILDHQRVTEPADDRAARGVGDGFDGEGAGHANRVTIQTRV
jgi:hypothetical protein